MSGTVGDNTARASGVIASAGGGGKILQVQSYSTAALSSQSDTSSFVDISSFLVTLTPAATDSRIWINVSVGMFGCSGEAAIFAVERAISGGTTELCPPVGTVSSARLGGHGRGFSDGTNYGSAVNFGILDVTHNTTSEITYQLQWAVQAQAYLNRSYNDANDAVYGARTVSGITAWEIGA